MTYLRTGLVLGVLVLAACTTTTGELVDVEIIPEEVMLPVRGLCNTLEQSRSIISFQNGPPGAD